MPVQRSWVSDGARGAASQWKPLTPRTARTGAYDTYQRYSSYSERYTATDTRTNDLRLPPEAVDLSDEKQVDELMLWETELGYEEEEYTPEPDREGIELAEEAEKLQTEADLAEAKRSAAGGART